MPAGLELTTCTTDSVARAISAPWEGHSLWFRLHLAMAAATAGTQRKAVGTALPRASPLPYSELRLPLPGFEPTALRPLDDLTGEP